MTEEKEIVSETTSEEKNDNNVEEESEIDSAIITQVEYYFGDANLSRDKFLREQVKLDEGWVPLEVLTRFHRLAKLSTDIDVIATALNKATSGLLEVSEDNKKVRRNTELPLPEMNEERRKELLSRTVYAKGFPREIELDELLKYFKEHGDIETVIMRRYPDKHSNKRLFKGSVFAMFKNKEEADKFIQSKGLKYGDTELITLWQEDYLKQKQVEYEERKQKREKKHQDKEANNTNKPKEEFKLPTGTVFHFSEGHDKMKREHIRDALVALGADIAYIDFKYGDTTGWVRLTKENAAKELAEKITDGKVKIGETEVLFKLLEGDEEKEYLDKTVAEMSKRRKNQKNFSKNKGNKNFRGKYGRKRRQDQSEDEPPKKVKADS